MTRRLARVNVLLREELGQLLARELKDPRIPPFTSVTQVETSADLRSARVFISIMGTEEEKRRGLKGLQAASHFLQRGLWDRLSLRNIPELHFFLDHSIEAGARLLQRMAQLDSREKADEDP